MFLTRNFLFTSWDTFAVGCIILPQNTEEKRAAEITSQSEIRLSELKTQVGQCAVSDTLCWHNL